MKYKILLVLILILAFVLRLYRINNPIGDWHAFRQADTSAVSKDFVVTGFHILTPTYFDTSNIQSGLDNPNGYRMVEFPIYNIFQAGGFLIFNLFSLEIWGRIITILSSLLTAIFIYLLVKKFKDEWTGLFSAFFFAVLPFSIYYGRVILPDPSATMAIFAGMYFLSRALDVKKVAIGFFLLAIIFTSASFLLKPFTLFFTLPMIYIAWNTYGLSFIKKWFLWLFLVISLIPFILWRAWISQFPEGIPASNWLFNEGNIRFTGAYFYWIFGDRIGKLLLGYVGYVFLLLGFLKNKDSHFGFFFSLFVSSVLYITIIARGNVQHDYYQILILPVICIFLGRGLSYVLSLPAKSIESSFYNTIAVGFLTIFSIGGMIFFSWYHVRDYFNINNEGFVIAGRKADEVLPKNARVIAANNGDTSFLYYINRKGWPAYQKSPEELAQMGATHIVIPSPTKEDYEGLGRTYSIFYSSPQVLILTLTK